MGKLKIIATIVAKAEFTDDVLKALHKVTDATRKEEGNISYTLHKNTADELKFIILEEWKSQEAIDFHNQTVHFQTFKVDLDGKIESLDVDVVQEIY